MEPPTLETTEGADRSVLAAIARSRSKVLAEPAGANWGELGMVFGAHGYDAEAGKCLAEAERLDADDARWPYLRGVLAVAHAPAEAETHLRRAMDRELSAEARTAIGSKLAEVLIERGDLDAAAELLRDTTSGRSRFGQGQIALARNDHAAARERFASVANDPYCRKKVAIAMAALSREAGEMAAASHFEDAARHLPNDPSWPDPFLVELWSKEVGRQGLLREAEALESAGQLHEAARLLMTLSQSDPSPRVLVSAGVVLGKLGDFGSAEGVFREVLRREPDQAQARYFLAVMLMERAASKRTDAETSKRLFEEAKSEASKAVELKPDHGLAWLYLGRSKLELGDASGAVSALREAVACRPEFVEPHLYLAEALLLDGKRAEAKVSLGNAEKLAKAGDERIRQLRGRIEGEKSPSRRE